MFQTLSILAIVTAIGLALLDYAVFRPQRRDVVAVRGLMRGVYLLFLVSLALMAFSSILMLAAGTHMYRWMLILHMAVAPLFAICIATLALLWNEQSRPNATLGDRAAFWIVITASFLVITSAILGMMTWFGSDGQRVLLNLHRASALILLIAAVYQAARLLAKNPHAARTGH